MKRFVMFVILGQMLVCGAAYGGPLADIDTMHGLTDEVAVELSSPDGKKGVWAMRDFRGYLGHRYHVEFIYGEAVRDWKAPGSGLDGNDAPLGFGATYQTYMIGDNHAIYEYRPNIGSSLTISVPGKAALTVESPTAKKDALEYVINAVLLAVPMN